MGKADHRIVINGATLELLAQWGAVVRFAGWIGAPVVKLEAVELTALVATFTYSLGTGQRRRSRAVKLNAADVQQALTDAVWQYPISAAVNDLLVTGQGKAPVRS